MALDNSEILNNRFTSGISEALEPEEPDLCPPATRPPLQWFRRRSAEADGATTSVIIISTQGGKCPLPPHQRGNILIWSFSDSFPEYLCVDRFGGNCVFLCTLWGVSESLCRSRCGQELMPRCHATVTLHRLAGSTCQSAMEVCLLRMIWHNLQGTSVLNNQQFARAEDQQLSFQKELYHFDKTTTNVTLCFYQTA